MTLHPQSVAAIALWAQEPPVTGPGLGPDDIAARRRSAREAAATEPREDVARVRDVDADGVPCRLYEPTPGTGHARGCTLFAHGGGFVFGDLDTHDAQCRRLANRTGLAVLAVDYRRPPEHRFPAAADDVDTALGWLCRHADDLGYGRLVALGDSAGGNLALVAALRNPGVFSATVLVYPFIDPTGEHYRPERDNGGLSAGECAWYWGHYAAPADLTDPDLAPIRSDRLGTLPCTLLVVAGEDILLGEDLELARRMEAAGADVSVSTYDGMVHGFWRQPALFDAAEESLAEIAAFLRRVV